MQLLISVSIPLQTHAASTQVSDFTAPALAAENIHKLLTILSLRLPHVFPWAIPMSSALTLLSTSF
jgi:hypothetical protein